MKVYQCVMALAAKPAQVNHKTSDARHMNPHVLVKVNSLAKQQLEIQ